MKKLIAAILLACTAVTLAACCDICGGFGGEDYFGTKICDDCIEEAMGMLG